MFVLFVKENLSSGYFDLKSGVFIEGGNLLYRKASIPPLNEKLTLKKYTFLPVHRTIRQGLPPSQSLINDRQWQSKEHNTIRNHGYAVIYFRSSSFLTASPSISGI